MKKALTNDQIKVLLALQENHKNRIPYNEVDFLNKVRIYDYTRFEMLCVDLNANGYLSVLRFGRCKRIVDIELSYMGLVCFEDSGKIRALLLRIRSLLSRIKFKHLLDIAKLLIAVVPFLFQ